MNPDILPTKYWKKKEAIFSYGQQQSFNTELINKLIKLQFFPRCIVIHQVIRSKLTRNDLIIGFDLTQRKRIVKTSRRISL